MTHAPDPPAQTDLNTWWASFSDRLAVDHVDYSEDIASNLITAAQAGLLPDPEATNAGLKLLKTVAPFERLWKLGEAGDTGGLAELANQGAIAAVWDTALARFLIANYIIPLPGCEVILTQARAAALKQMLDVHHKRPPAPMRNFLYALAQQCFLNEYVYWEEPDETMWVEVLASNITAMIEEGDPNTDIAIAVLGCYRNLEPWPGETRPDLTSVQSPDDGFREMMTRLVNDRLQERELAGSFAAMTPIEDETSQAVRSMYEENPYPRWRLSYLPPTAEPAAAIRWLFPFADMSAFGDTEAPRFLVAGCGTGYFASTIAKVFARGDVSAIDLSRASLAYAKRQADALGLKVNFAQADILALDPASLQVDIIECAGVLHHTADVMRAWKSLAACLRPGGLMQVALYNRHARGWLQAPRRLAQTGGYRATEKDIRRFRRDVLFAHHQPSALPKGLSSVLHALDFYTLSMSRDAFFHVQEREYSLREILAMAEALGLRFLGLGIGNSALRQRYLQRHPDDPSIRNLSYIEAEEKMQSDFGGQMYIVSVQKPA